MGDRISLSTDAADWQEVVVHMLLSIPLSWSGFHNFQGSHAVNLMVILNNTLRCVANQTELCGLTHLMIEGLTTWQLHVGQSKQLKNEMRNFQNKQKKYHTSKPQTSSFKICIVVLQTSKIFYKCFAVSKTTFNHELKFWTINLQALKTDPSPSLPPVTTPILSLL